MACAVQRDCSDERHLVLRAAPGLATGALATEVGVVELNAAREPMGRLIFWWKSQAVG